MLDHLWLIGIMCFVVQFLHFVLLWALWTSKYDEVWDQAEANGIERGKQLAPTTIQAIRTLAILGVRELRVTHHALFKLRCELEKTTPFQTSLHTKADLVIDGVEIYTIDKENQ